jgi:hypothetical protein
MGWILISILGRDTRTPTRWIRDKELYNFVGRTLTLLHSGCDGQRDRPREKSSTITAEEMAHTTTELDYPVPTNHAFGVQVPIVQFIDELERKHNPESSLRAVVLSNALRFSHLTRRTLNAANTRSTNSNHLRKLAKSSDRQYCKHQAEIMKVQVHEYLNSQVHRSFRQARDQGKERLCPQSISPQTILSAGRIDPFSSYPIDMTHYMHYLVDHCKTFHSIDMCQLQPQYDSEEGSF